MKDWKGLPRQRGNLHQIQDSLQKVYGMCLHSFLSFCTDNIRSSAVSGKEVAVYLTVGKNILEVKILTYLPTAQIFTPSVIAI